MEGPHPTLPFPSSVVSCLGKALSHAPHTPHTTHTHRATQHRCILASPNAMSIYEEVEIEDMDFEEEEQQYTYPCPCGDKFVITLVRPWLVGGWVVGGRTTGRLMRAVWWRRALGGDVVAWSGRVEGRRSPWLDACGAGWRHVCIPFPCVLGGVGGRAGGWVGGWDVPGAFERRWLR